MVHTYSVTFDNPCEPRENCKWLLWASCRIQKIAHAPGMPGTFPPPPRFNDPDIHHGTCVTHVLRCMPGSLPSVFLWSRWLGKRSRHLRRMCNPLIYVSGKRPNADESPTLHNTHKLVVTVASYRTLTYMYMILVPTMAALVSDVLLIVLPVPFTNMDLLLSQHGWVIRSTNKCEMKLLIPPQTPTISVTQNTAWMNNNMTIKNVEWNNISIPKRQRLQCLCLEVWDWIIHFTSYFIMDVIIIQTGIDINPC